MCKANGNGLTNGVADPAGRPLDLEYKRNSCYCERCQMRRPQVFGHWCCQCWDVLRNDARIDWSQLTNAQFEQYARER